MGMADDAARSQVVLFGGSGGAPVHLGDTWIWDGTDWAQRTPAHSPPRRGRPGMAGDEAGGQVVLFVGDGPEDNRVFGGTWTWDGSDQAHSGPLAPCQFRHGNGLRRRTESSRAVRRVWPEPVSPRQHLDLGRLGLDQPNPHARSDEEGAPRHGL
jgi:hypothetical protein